MSTSIWYFSIILQAGINILILSVTLVDPGFVSYPMFIDVLKPQCNLCFTTKTDNARHCYVSGICVRDFDHFCIILGNCFTGSNSSRIMLLITLGMCHLILLGSWQLGLIN